MSKEDEERYHKLLAENDQLQQLIAAVNMKFIFIYNYIMKTKILLEC